MRYVQDLITRVVLALVLASSYEFFYVIFAPLTLDLSYAVLKVFYSNAVLAGNIITVGVQELEFVKACVAASAYLLLALLVLLTKGIAWKDRLWMFVAGSFLILVMNIIRIEVLIYVLLEHGKNYFETLHLLFWKIIASIYVAAVWIFLAWKFKVKTIPLWSDVQYLVKQVRRK